MEDDDSKWSLGDFVLLLSIIALLTYLVWSQNAN